MNLPIKRHRVAGWSKKQDQAICCLQEAHLSSKDQHWLKVKGWKVMLEVNGSQKKGGIAILISDRTDFKPKKVTTDKDGHYIITKGTIYQEEIVVINIYAPNIRVTQCI